MKCSVGGEKKKETVMVRMESKEKEGKQMIVKISKQKSDF